eukprot:11158038-Lingulodinium_polyedra.AAC.1
MNAGFRACSLTVAIIDEIADFVGLVFCRCCSGLPKPEVANTRIESKKLDVATLAAASTLHPCSQSLTNSVEPWKHIWHAPLT